MKIPGYVIHKELGQGGMSKVYLATQESFGRLVALKVLLPAYLANKDFTSRFLREAKIVAGFSHPHIVPVYDVGSHGEYYYMSMDYLAGGDLRRWIQRGLVVEEVLQITEGIAMALHYADSKGYIHRDVKPENILFREDNSPVLTDFGISRLKNANDLLTHSGSIVGTPRYMSPEVIQDKQIDGRADIYSLGVVFYEMLMKQPPFEAEEFMALGFKHVSDPVPVLPEHLKKLQPFLNRGMAKLPGDRFRNGLEMAKAIRELRLGADTDSTEPVVSSSPTPVTLKIDLNENWVNDSLMVGDFLIPPTDGMDAQKKALPLGIKKPDALKKLQSNPVIERKRPREQTVFGEEETRKWLLFKRYAFTCDLTIYDPANFAIIFSSLTSRLLDWRDKRGFFAQGFHLRLTGTARVLDRAKLMFDHLLMGEGAMTFVRRLQITIIMEDVDTGEIASYTPAF